MKNKISVMRAALVAAFFITLAPIAAAQTNPGQSPLSIPKGGTAAATASQARTNLGLAIGSNVQAWDADLDCIAALSSTGFVSRTGAGTCAVRTITVTSPIQISNGDGVSGAPSLSLLANGISNSLFRQSSALSIVGRSANSTGDVADISATPASDCVFRESGSVLGCGQVATGGLANNAVTDAKIRQGGALSIIGRPANSTGNVGDIQATAASDGVLRESGSTIGFGTVATGGLANNAVTDAKLRQGSALSLIGRSANSTGNVADIPATAASDCVFRESGSALGCGQVATGGLANNAVTNSKAAQMAANTVKCNNTGSLANAIDCTVSQIKTLFAYAIGDLASIGNNTIVCNQSGSSGPPLACSISQIKAFLTYAFSDVTGRATFAQLPQFAANSIACNNTASPSDSFACSVAQVKTLLAYAFSDLSGRASFSQLPSVSNNTIACNQSGSTGDLLACSISQVKAFLTYAFSDITGSLSSSQLPAFSGDVSTSAGSSVTSIGSNKVTNSQLAQIGARTIKGNATGSTANVSDVSPATARSSSLLNIEDLTSIGDANYTILSTDRMVVHTALTAARTDTLPAANSVNKGQRLVLADFGGVASGSNTVTVQRAGSDTINGVTSVVAIGAQYGAAIFWSDGVSKWTFYPASTGGGGSGTVTQVNTSNGIKGGPITNSGTVELDINSLIEDTSPDGANDFVATYDTSASGHKKVRLSKLGAKPADVQTFTSTGAQTWTKPTGFSSKATAFIQCWGAGGGADRESNTNNLAGGGGGAYNERWITLSSLGSTETVTIGAGGLGRTGSTGAGSDGGNTTFGSWLTAWGGGGANPGVNAGFGGGFLSAKSNPATSTNAQNPFNGGTGSSYGASAGAALFGGGGGGANAGGASATGGASVAASQGASAVAGTPSKPGFAGGGAASTSANTNGGDGGDGKCIVTVFDGA